MKSLIGSIATLLTSLFAFSSQASDARYFMRVSREEMARIRSEELDVVLDIHTGFCWAPPEKSKYSLTILLDDMARDFPGQKNQRFP